MGQRPVVSTSLALILAACAGPGSNEPAAEATASTPTAVLPVAMTTAASSAAPAITTRPATAQDGNLQLAQIVDVDAYLASPATHQLFSAASAQAACAPVVGDLKFQLPRTAKAVAEAAVAGAIGGGLGLLTGDGVVAVVAGAVAAGGSLAVSMGSQLPGLITSMKDVAACGAGSIRAVDSGSYAGSAAPAIPSYDPQAPGCLVVRLGGHTVTDCKMDAPSRAGQ